MARYSGGIATPPADAGDLLALVTVGGRADPASGGGRCGGLSSLELLHPIRSVCAWGVCGVVWCVARQGIVADGEGRVWGKLVKRYSGERPAEKVQKEKLSGQSEPKFKFASIANDNDANRTLPQPQKLHPPLSQLWRVSSLGTPSTELGGRR